MKANTANWFYGARRFARDPVGFESRQAFVALTQKVGVSAATTYISQRARQGATVAQALGVARAQVAVLGATYQGGFDCVPFRIRKPEVVLAAS